MYVASSPVAGSVVLPLQRGDRQGDRHLALDLLRLGVQHGAALVGAPCPLEHAGPVQQRPRRARSCRYRCGRRGRRFVYGRSSERSIHFPPWFRPNRSGWSAHVNPGSTTIHPPVDRRLSSGERGGDRGALRLSAGSRRSARHRRPPRARVPRRFRLDVGRLRRRVGVLHAVGLSHHVTGARRARSNGKHRHRGVLCPACAPAAARQRGVSGRGDRRRPAAPVRRHHGTTPGPVGRRRPGVQLGAAGQGRQLRHRDGQDGGSAVATRPLLVAGHRGAVLLAVAARPARSTRRCQATPSRGVRGGVGGLRRRRHHDRRRLGRFGQLPRHAGAAAGDHHRRRSRRRHPRGPANSGEPLAGGRRVGGDRRQRRVVAGSGWTGGARHAAVVRCCVGRPDRWAATGVGRPQCSVDCTAGVARADQLRGLPVPLADLHAGRRASPHPRPGSTVRRAAGDHRRGGCRFLLRHRAARACPSPVAEIGRVGRRWGVGHPRRCRRGGARP